MVVSDLEGAHRAIRPHPLTVRAECSHGGGPPLFATHARVTTGNLEAGRESLDVPLPRTASCLVEIVDVEHQVAFGCGVAPEVEQMAVTTELRVVSRDRRARQIAG